MALKRKVESEESPDEALDAEDLLLLEAESGSNASQVNVSRTPPSKALKPLSAKLTTLPVKPSTGLIKNATKGLGIVKKKTEGEQARAIAETVAVGMAAATGAILRDNQEVKSHVAVRAMRAFVYSIDSTD